jgi:hypothetical protein
MIRESIFRAAEPVSDSRRTLLVGFNWLVIRFTLIRACAFGKKLMKLSFNELNFERMLFARSYLKSW